MRHKRAGWSRLCATLLLVVSLIPARAGIMAAATRVIFTQGQANQSLMLANTNDYPIVVQTWVDHGGADPNVQVPFLSLPSVFQLQPRARQSLRIVLAEDASLPHDRESVFWLNLHEIPPTPKDSAARDTLALAMNTQMKIFYRPAGLPKPDIAAQLRFNLVQHDGTWYVQCDNPTPYHASFTLLQVVDTNGMHTEANSEMDMMTAPFTQRLYYLGEQPPAGGTLHYTLVDDAGFVQPFQAVLAR